MSEYDGFVFYRLNDKPELYDIFKKARDIAIKYDCDNPSKIPLSYNYKYDTIAIRADVDSVEISIVQYNDYTITTHSKTRVFCAQYRAEGLWMETYLPGKGEDDTLNWELRLDRLLEIAKLCEQRRDTTDTTERKNLRDEISRLKDRLPVRPSLVITKNVITPEDNQPKRWGVMQKAISRIFNT